VANLTVEVGGFDDVVVDDTYCADACSGDVLSGRAAETTSPDNEDAGVYEPELTCVLSVSFGVLYWSIAQNT